MQVRKERKFSKKLLYKLNNQENKSIENLSIQIMRARGMEWSLIDQTQAIILAKKYIEKYI